MLIRNVTSDKLLADRVRVAKSLLDKTIGLLSKKGETAMVLNTRFGIHTFFMASPIDIIVLNDLQQIVKIVPALKPFRFFFWDPKYSLVVELPENTVQNSGSRIGDKILITS